jgi:hypothetical protein
MIDRIPPYTDEQREMVDAALAADREASLRDMFAAAALAGVVPHFSYKDAAKEAYFYADAMLAARKC